MLTISLSNDSIHTSPMIRTKDQNFGLTESAFEELLHELREGINERLVETIFVHQYKPCRDLLINKYKASYDEAHEVVMDTLLKFRQDLIAGKLSFANLSSLFKTQSWQQFIKRTSREKRLFFDDTDDSSLQNKADDSDGIVEILEDAETKQVFKVAFSKLGDKCKMILKNFYYEGLQLKQIAQMNNLSEGAVRVDATECRKKLKKYFLHYSKY